ncbi:hypothetical protein NPIL_387151 [Nephila pilipes]|uniref:Uncharacterized protein n=1 Tax=Nephila pilipes TaxID=299642 RepID=A0A8X6TBU4_NEPPI|nr:hypothetical protein NPIL_387151 [Nephila pilipes]
MEVGVPQDRCVRARNEILVSRIFRSRFLYAEILLHVGIKHVRAYRVTSCLIDDHTKHSATNFRDTLIPGYESEGKLLKISRLKNFGTNGRT